MYNDFDNHKKIFCVRPNCTFFVNDILQLSGKDGCVMENNVLNKMYQISHAPKWLGPLTSLLAEK